MSFDFAELKAQTRQALHDAMAVSALYLDDDLVMPAELTVRWHNKIDRFGDIENVGYSELVEGINRVIFNIPQLTELGIALQAGGELTITAPGFDDAVLVLTAKEPKVGPIEEIWLVGVRP